MLKSSSISGSNNLHRNKCNFKLISCYQSIIFIGGNIMKKVLFLQQSPYDDSLKRINSFLSDTLGFDVESIPLDRVRTVTQYDFIVWHYSAGGTGTSAMAEKISFYNIPTILIEGEGFPLSKSLGLIDRNVRGDTIYLDGVPVNGDKIYAVQMEGLGTGHHFLLQGKGFKRYDLKESSDIWDFGQPEHLGFNQGHVHTMSAPYTSANYSKYTRPILTALDYNNFDNIVALVNDRRFIVASGMYENSHPYVPPTVGYNFEVDDNRYWDFMHQMVLFVTSVSQTKNSIGQNIVTETDLVVPSKGFDFTIKRTYTSGTWNLNSYLGPSWISNHDQYIIWDKFNDRLQFFNGTGRAVEMEMVQGSPVENPADENSQEPLGQRTFVSINSGVTDIAIYFPPDNSNPLTLTNPRLEEVTEKGPNNTKNSNDIKRSLKKISSNKKQNITKTTELSFQSGFLIRDRNGNITFFAYHPIRYTSLFHQSTNPSTGSNGIVGDKNLRTRGGELGYYRIAYIQDANGNRQNYYYENRQSLHNWYGSRMPEDLICCIVDTEGRRYNFNTIWAHIYCRVNFVPWIKSIETPEGLPNIKYNFIKKYEYDDMANPHGVLLEEVEWLEDGAQNPLCTKSYEYLYTSEEEENYLAYIPPLHTMSDKKGRVVKRFDYEPVIREKYIYDCQASNIPHSDEYYYHGYAFRSGKLTKIISGIESEETLTEFLYNTYSGFGNRQDLQSVQALITTLKGETAVTVAINSYSHITKNLLWNRNDWNPEDPDFNPFNSCQGLLRTFETNFDGQIVKEVSPSGIVNERKHLMDIVFEASQDPYNKTPIEAKLLEFWKNYWHLRFWLLNEISLKTIGKFGEKEQVFTFEFEPVFNRKLNEFEMQRLKCSYRFDYMEDGHWNETPSGHHWYGMTNEELFELMLIPYATNNEIWPDILAGAEYQQYKFFENIPWIAQSRQESNLPDYIFDENEPTAGNVIKKILPATSDFGESKGRPEAVEIYGYDGYGRQIYHRNLDERVTIQKYTDDKSYPFDKSETTFLERIIERINNETGKKTSEKEYIDKNGLTKYKLKSISALNFVYNEYLYDQWGRVINNQSGNIAINTKTTEKKEEFQYDKNGNLIAYLKYRNPEEIVIPTNKNTKTPIEQPGDILWELKVYDSLNRIIIDGKKIGEQKNIEIFTFIEYVYNNSNLLEAKRTYSNCLISKDHFRDQSTLENAIIESLTDGQFEIETQYFYNIQNLVCREITTDRKSAPREIIRDYNEEGQLISVRDPENVWNTKKYDGLARLTQAISGIINDELIPDTNSLCTTYEYDDFDNKIKEISGRPLSNGQGTDKAYGERRYFYDERDMQIAQLVKQYPLEKPDNSIIEVWTYYQYNQVDLIVKEIEVTPTYQSYIETQYDGLGRVKSVQNFHENTKEEFKRDDLGRVCTHMNYHFQNSGTSNAVVTKKQFQYNSNDQIVLEREIDTLGKQAFRVNQNFYDGYGFLIKNIDAEKHSKTFLYDGLGNPIKTTFHLSDDSNDGYWKDGNWISYKEVSFTTEYNYLGVVKKRTDAHGFATIVELNGFGEIKQVIRADGSFKIFELNKSGSVTDIFDSEGRHFYMEIDRFQRPTKVYEKNKLSQTFEYFTNGKLKTSVDLNIGNNHVKKVIVMQEWDTLENLILDKTIIEDLNKFLENETVAQYEGERIIQLIFDSNNSTRKMKYIYYENHPNQLHQIKLEEELLAEYQWVGRMLLQKEVFNGQNRVVTERLKDAIPSYDGFGNLANQNIYLLDSSNNETSLHNYSYSYNKNNRLLKELSEAGGNDPDYSEYVLDDIERVKQFKKSNLNQQINLDEVNNVRQIADTDNQTPPDSGINYEISSNGLHQITEVENIGNDADLLEHDKVGNLLKDGQQKYVWDPHNRLIEIRTQSDDLVASYAYDALNRRVAKQIFAAPSEAIYYRLFDSDVLEEIQFPLKGNTKNWHLTILHDPITLDRYLRWDYSVIEGGTTYKKTSIPIADIRNNIVASIDQQGDIEAIVYDLYGNEISSENSGYIPYRFAGRKYDKESKLYYFRSRYYSPAFARFLSIDNIGVWGDLNNFGNGYAYVGNMENTVLDPYGLNGFLINLGIGVLANLIWDTIRNPGKGGSSSSNNYVILDPYEIEKAERDILVYRDIEKFYPDVVAHVKAVREWKWKKWFTKMDNEIAKLAEDEKKWKDYGMPNFDRLAGDARKKRLAKQKERDQGLEDYVNQQDPPKDADDANLLKTTDDEDSQSSKRPSPDDGGGVTPIEIYSMIMKMLMAGGRRSKEVNDIPYFEDVVLTGGIGDLIKRRSRGSLGSERPPVYVNEDGDIIVETWRLHGSLGQNSSIYDSMMFLLWVNPNIGGGIDPPPPFAQMGGRGIVIPVVRNQP